MGLSDDIRRMGKYLGGEPHADGEAELHIGDARFDDWEVLKDFDDLEAARAWRQTLTERDITSVLTSDYELDEFGKGDVSLRVPKDEWSEASDAFEPELD